MDIDSILDASEVVPRYDIAGKRLPTEGRVEWLLENSHKLAHALLSEKHFRDRLDDPPPDKWTKGMPLAEYFCRGFEGLMAQETAPGFEAGREIAKKMDRYGIVGKITF